ncbi:MAG: helix-turn-helix transcriptional regulator [Oscillospiraceae bacterium]|nr:helix-turn-helix transcriptional regulator [Oscillospiraceae bacterium]
MPLNAHRITVLRKERGMTQGELAQMLGLAQSTLSQYEAGTRRLPTDKAERIADVLGVPMETMFTKAETPDHHIQIEVEVRCRSFDEIPNCAVDFDALQRAHPEFVFGRLKIIVDRYHSSTSRNSDEERDRTEVRR